MENYKEKNSVIYTNRKIRNQINIKVRQKLAIQWLTSQKMRKNLKEIAKNINYCMGFMKIADRIKGEKVWEIVNEAIEDTFEKLPETPNEIPEEIRNILPFELSVKNRGNLRAILAALRKIYKFARLPEEYLVQLEPLLPNPRN